MLNPEIAYLLGMVVGKGEVRRGNDETKVLISIPHKNLQIEGLNTQDSIRASLLDITNRLQELVGTDLKTDTSNNFVAILYFSKPNGDFLIRTFNSLLENKITWREFRIPEQIFGASEDIKKEFLRGFADVTGHIRKSNLAYGQQYGHRVYLEIMDNWELVIDIANLLKTLDIPIQNIRWAHPNFVDPQIKIYRKGTNNTYKEHQIKIWADEFEKVGFNIDHKNSLLRKYAEMNRDNWNKETPLEKSHHRFYWRTRDIQKTKPKHPDENNPRIHPKIKGKHFDSWREIAKELGYHE